MNATLPAKSLATCVEAAARDAIVNDLFFNGLNQSVSLSRVAE